MLSRIIGYLRNLIAQVKADVSIKAEFKGHVEATIVMNELKRIETKLTGRLDALENYVDDVMERYLRKISARENRERKKEIEEDTQLPLSPYQEIMRKHGR